MVLSSSAIASIVRGKNALSNLLKDMGHDVAVHGEANRASRAGISRARRPSLGA